MERTPDHLLERGRKVLADRERIREGEREGHPEAATVVGALAIPQAAIDAGAGVGLTEQGVRDVLLAMATIQEWAVPCLSDHCRELYGSREAAEAAARHKGGVVEHRLATPWRPL